MPTTVDPIDTKDRAAVVSAYTNSYLPTVGVAMGWTGDHASCTPGATSSAYRDATILRTNYYRAMAGVSGTVVFDATLDADYQSAALMQAKNAPPLDHNPPVTWLCYTVGGDDASEDANLALGNGGAEAVGAYMDDNGLTYAGHRRWVLYPIQVTMATGSVSSPQIANALGVIVPGGYGSVDAYSETVLGNGWLSHPDFVRAVCWPPPRYCPYQILPANSKMWSLSIHANASPDFSAATVTMTKDNGATPVTANIQALEVGYGDKTLVWEVPSISYAAPGADTDYEVTVGNVGIGTRSQKQTFTYTVTVIDPSA